ncbi:hypothetical protein KKH03_03610, partial [Patescibacteria group bacterium]|nr:hypothetical protein [Patescibacteria group bacterium]
FPAFCFGCRREGSFVCDDCFWTIHRSGCGFESVEGEGLDGLLSCCGYEEKGFLARLIHAFKYDFIVDLQVPLGILMAEGLCEAVFGKNVERRAVLCPVPLHKKRLKWRGFNQAELLAEQVSEYLGLPVVQLLRRTKFKRPQKELSREERILNMEGAFEVLESGLEAGTDFPLVLLVDDVATTLSTLQACASALKKSGVKKVYGIVLARVY